MNFAGDTVQPVTVYSSGQTVTGLFLLLNRLTAEGNGFLNGNSDMEDGLEAWRAARRRFGGM